MAQLQRGSFGQPSSVVSGVSPSGDTTGATDTAAIQAKINALSSGGVVLLTSGTFYTTGLTLPSNVALEGKGESTVLQLANGANTDVIQGAGFTSLTGTTSTGGVAAAQIRSLVIDGNASNQSASRTDTVSFTSASPVITDASCVAADAGKWVTGTNVAADTFVTSVNPGVSFTVNKNPTGTGTSATLIGGRGVALYGYRNKLRDIIIRNCYSDGLWTEWGGGTNGDADAVDTYPLCENFKFHNNGQSGTGHGWTFKGPHDSQASNGSCVANGTGTSRGILALSALRCFGVHCWGAPQQISFDVSSESYFEGCVAEVTNTSGSRGYRWNFVRGAIKGGLVLAFGNCPSGGNVGVELFGPGATFGVDIDTMFVGCVGADVLISGDSGGNVVRGLSTKTSGPAVSGWATTVAAGSSGAQPSTWVGAGVLNVASAASFSSTGNLALATSTGGCVVSYTGKTGTTFTGVTFVSGATGTLSTGGSVTSAGALVNGVLLSDLTRRNAATSFDIRSVGGTTTNDVNTRRSMRKATGSLSPSASAATYGTSTWIVPNGGGAGLEAIHIGYVSAGTFNSETVTMQAVGYFSDGSFATTSHGVAATATSNVWTNSDFYTLAKDGVDLVAVSLACQSSIANSVASVTYSVAFRQH